MLTPYWQLDPTDATRLAWAIKHWIAHDPETGVHLRVSPRQYILVIPEGTHPIYLRFRASDDRAAFAKACTRLAKWSAQSPAPR